MKTISNLSAWSLEKMTIRVMAFIVVSCTLSSFGVEISLPVVPPSDFVDCESVIHAPISADMLRRSSVFSGELTLFATPSNMVEVAFGTSRNGDGVLLPGDETFSVGWRGGTWFFASATNCVASSPVGGSGRRTLSFQLRFSEEGQPIRLSLAASGMEEPFPELVDAPPAWMFSREWDAVRLTIRGVDTPEEDVSVRFEADPWVLILR